MTTLETVRVDLNPAAVPSSGYSAEYSGAQHQRTYSASTTSGAYAATTHAQPPPATPANGPQEKRVHREVRFGSYILGSTLGEGEFGKVKLGWRKDGKQPSQVAIKLIKRDSIARDSESEVKIHREINSLKMLSHPNIVNLVEVMKSGKYIGIVLEYCSGGELFDYILHHKYLKEQVAKKLFAQLVSGVDYMHAKGLVHRDLKLENLLLDKHKNVIISDFGFVNSYRSDDLMKTSCGSPCYAAPELVLSQQRYHGRKVDIWSLGVILYAMLAGYLPFDDDPENEDGSDIVRLYQYICKTPLTFPEYVSPLARDLLRKIIVPDPKKRIDMPQIMTHPWLQPHAQMLSIPHAEWDRVSRESRAVQPVARSNTTAAQSSTASKRYSMIQERTTSSLLSATPRAASSTTSSSFASAVAIPRPVSIGNQGGLTPLASSQFTGSSVGASTSPMPPSSYKVIPKSSVPRSTTVSAIDTIVEQKESPRQPPAATLPGTALNGMVSDSPPSTISSFGSANPASTTNVSTASSNRVGPASTLTPSAFGNFSTHTPTRLPHQKPRPTSYHPSSLSSSLLTDLYKTNNLSTSPTKAPPSSQTTDENASPERSPKSKRNSVLIYLEDKIEQLDLRSEVAQVAAPPVPSKEGSATAAAISHFNRLSASYATPPPPVPVKDSPKPPPVPPKDRSKRASQFGASSPSAPPVSQPNSNNYRSSVLPRRAQSTRETKSRSSSGASGDDDKENNPKRKNRFSLLSFYSGYNSSSQSISALAKETKPSTPLVATAPAAAKRPLEPNSDHNISPTAKRNVSMSSTGSKRSTGSTASSVQGKEASAARKVMDFFKRRSVRLG
ncbi:serine/threonine-protein kinase Kin4p [Diutina catenulata]